ncbi:MAG TPA: PP2C family protein-serine/threonine phosphatase [Bryobacteraceae bacterium]|nr:PP2C family protein-serine/threonine phosphatase [Bryobacteraceae bacterium]
MPKGMFQRRRDQEQYLPTLPGQAFAGLMLAVFVTQACALVDMDLMNGLRGPFWWVLTKGAAYGLAVALSLMATRNQKRFVAKAALAIALILIFVFVRVDSGLAQKIEPGAPAQQDIAWRVTMDGTISLIALSLGYVLFFRSMVSQGIKHVRTRAELVLAEQVQQALAPPLATRNAGYEVQGRSAPGSQMGGDLLDAVDDPAGMTIYVADVAGHGIQAGVFMGMVKSSVRTALLRPVPLAGLLNDLNRVVFEVKPTPETYVTFACLRCSENGKVEYSLAGCGPILHYKARSMTVTELAMEHFPLGLFGNATFQSGAVEIEPGDILALSTDGLPETTDANDEQFGLERMGEIIPRNAAGPLAEITEAVFEAVRRHGMQTDDETLVLVRAARGPGFHADTAR